LEPSYVIRKFLKEQQHKVLIEYLMKLHTVEYSTSNHTKLLLKCITKKPNDENETNEKLNQIVENTQDNLSYDHNTVIETLRETGHLDHAIKLAKNVKSHDWYIKIHLEKDEIEACNIALSYIETLEFEDAEKYLKKYSEILVQKIPKRTTNVLIRLCVGYKKIFDDEKRQILTNSNFIDDNSVTSNSIKKEKTKTVVNGWLGTYVIEELETNENMEQAVESEKIGNVSEFIKYYANNDYWLMVLLENVVERVIKSLKLVKRRSSYQIQREKI
jgi:vacuolar protein sorting-associated protein 11